MGSTTHPKRSKRPQFAPTSIKVEARSKKNLRVREVSGSNPSNPCQNNREAIPIPEFLPMDMLLPLGKRIVTPFLRTFRSICRAAWLETKCIGFEEYASSRLK